MPAPPPPRGERRYTPAPGVPRPAAQSGAPERPTVSLSPGGGGHRVSQSAGDERGKDKSLAPTHYTG